MVKKVTFFTDKTEKLFSINEITVDVCKSHTLIHKKFETIRLPLTVQLIQIIDRKITVMYENDYCLTIFPY